MNNGLDATHSRTIVDQVQKFLEIIREFDVPVEAVEPADILKRHAARIAQLAMDELSIRLAGPIGDLTSLSLLSRFDPDVFGNGKFLAPDRNAIREIFAVGNSLSRAHDRAACHHSRTRSSKGECSKVEIAGSDQPHQSRQRG